MECERLSRSRLLQLVSPLLECERPSTRSGYCLPKLGRFVQTFTEAGSPEFASRTDEWGTGGCLCAGEMECGVRASPDPRKQLTILQLLLPNCSIPFWSESGVCDWQGAQSRGLLFREGIEGFGRPEREGQKGRAGWRAHAGATSLY